MPRFPYMNFPFPYYNSRRFSNSYSNSPYPTFSANFQNAELINFQNVNTNNFKNNTTTHFEKTKNKSNNNNNDYLFDLFGLKIYTDDVLLVSLIYFLYSEGVKDEGLFIVLILLLLS